MSNYNCILHHMPHLIYSVSRLVYFQGLPKRNIRNLKWRSSLSFLVYVGGFEQLESGHLKVESALFSLSEVVELSVFSCNR